MIKRVRPIKNFYYEKCLNYPGEFTAYWPGRDRYTLPNEWFNVTKRVYSSYETGFKLECIHIDFEDLKINVKYFDGLEIEND